MVAAPPGFINFTLSNTWLTSQVDEILAAGKNYGTIGTGKGRKVQVEFVSINPTGPLHVGHGRGAILGSTLSNVLTAAGCNTEKEYYFNDAGNQINTFKRSLYARYLQVCGKEAEVPADGYHGNYMTDIAKEILDAEGDGFLALSEEEATEKIGAIGLEKVIGQIKEDLKLVGVEFDVWFTEKSLYANGQYDAVLDILKTNEYVAEREGATWFVSTALGEDKDNVIVRSDGTPTYFAADIAYHYNKFIERKFDRVINIGGGPQGQLPAQPRVSAMVVDPEKLEVIIHQW